METQHGKGPGPSGRWVWALLAAAVILLAFLPLLLTRSSEEPVATTVPARYAEEGWIAFSAVGPDLDYDLYFVGIGQTAFRVAGDDFDNLDQLCPAFSPDGTRLAYGEAEGTIDTGYSNGALVVADVSFDGSLSESFRIETGSDSVPSCPTWSPDGEKIAASVRAGDDSTQLIQRPRLPGDIWIVNAGNQPPTVLKNLFVAQDRDPSNLWSDLEWSPDGAELATTQRRGIMVSTVADGESRIVEGTEWARLATWSPDGTRIAYESRLSSSGNPAHLRVSEIDGLGGYTLAEEYDSSSGIGPVWSPAGDQIVYQRGCYPAAEDQCNPFEHEVVLVTLEGDKVVLSDLRLPGDERIWWPNRVTWSPDGSHLLYLAWVNEFDEQERVPQALIARPIDPESSPTVLFQPPPVTTYWDDINTFGEGFQLAYQTWARPTLS